MASNRSDLRHTRHVTDPAGSPSGEEAASSQDASVGFVALVGSLAMLPAIATDIYLPSLPTVAAELATTTAAAQFTVTGVFVGTAFGQLMWGPLSDRFGRRIPAVVGLATQLVLSLASAFAPTIAVLATLRVLQGFMAAATMVAAMATIRDRFVGAEAARLISQLMLVVAAAPLFAPTVGSAIAARWGWRAVFVAVALVAAMILVAVVRALPETLAPERRRREGFQALVRGYWSLTRDRQFVSLAVLPGLGMAVVMAYVSGSSFVFQEQFALSSQQFSLVFALGGVSLVVGTQLNAAVVRRIGPARLLRAFALVAVLFAVLLRVGVTLDLGLAAMVGALWFTLLALGFVNANASALALSRHGERAGTAAASIGFLQSGIGGGVGTVVGLLGGDAASMANVILASTVMIVVVLALATPAYRRDGWIRLGAEGIAELPSSESSAD
jgi:MFS transporter, DHA1 family, multidrug resistance protein